MLVSCRYLLQACAAPMAASHATWILKPFIAASIEPTTPLAEPGASQQ